MKTELIIFIGLVVLIILYLVYKYFVETDKNEYYRLQQSSDQKYYHFAEVLWKISGPLYDVKQNNVLIVGGIIDSNKRSTQEAEKNMLGISNYLTDLTLYSTF